MNLLSICSGIDAASVAWEPLGWKAVGFSEIEPFPCAVLAHHWPHVPNLGDIVGALTARHDSSPCADRGQNVVCVHGTQDPCTDETLAFALGRNSGQENVIAFSCKDHGADAGEISSTLRSMNHDSSHANGGGQVAVAFTLPIYDMSTRHQGTNGSGKNVGKGHGLGIGAQDDPMFTLTKGDHHAVAFRSCGQEGFTAADISPALMSSNGGGTVPSLLANAAVRRLTPTECERLQGFPDDHTLIPWRGKPAADGPRYKALGNSMAVPVIRWIGERIEKINQLTK